jgi:hypothetical protein
VKPAQLSPDETAYLLGLIREPLEYYRLLSGNGKATSASRAKLLFLETLVAKLEASFFQSGFGPSMI